MGRPCDVNSHHILLIDTKTRHESEEKWASEDQNAEIYAARTQLLSKLKLQAYLSADDSTVCIWVTHCSFNFVDICRGYGNRKLPYLHKHRPVRFKLKPHTHKNQHRCPENPTWAQRRSERQRAIDHPCGRRVASSLCPGFSAIFLSF